MSRAVALNQKAIVGMVRAAALAAALFLAGAAVPFVGIVIAMFAPAPVLGYAVGRSRALLRTLGAVLLAAFLIVVAAGPLQGCAYAVTVGLATLLMVEMLERRQPFERIVLVTTACVAVACAVGLIAATGSPQALATDVRHALSTALSRSESFYQSLGMGWSGEEADARSRLLDLTVRLSPAVAMLSFGFGMLANLGLFWRWQGKERLSYTLFGGLTRWRAPEWVIWLFLAAGFGLLAPLQPLRDFALDAFICVAAIYFCQGLAIMAFYFQMLSMPIAARGIVYFISVVQPVLATLVCAMGVFDMWVDFRRLKPSRPEPGGFGDFF